MLLSCTIPLKRIIQTLHAESFWQVQRYVTQLLYPVLLLLSLFFCCSLSNLITDRYAKRSCKRLGKLRNQHSINVRRHSIFYGGKTTISNCYFLSITVVLPDLLRYYWSLWIAAATAIMLRVFFVLYHLLFRSPIRQSERECSVEDLCALYNFFIRVGLDGTLGDET